MNFIKENLMDIVLVLGILLISTGAFLISIVTGFFTTGTMLILFAASLYILGGD